MQADLVSCYIPVTQTYYRLSHESMECTTNKFNFLPLTTHKIFLLLKENHTSSLTESSVKKESQNKDILNNGS